VEEDGDESIEGETGDGDEAGDVVGTDDREGVVKVRTYELSDVEDDVVGKDNKEGLVKVRMYEV